MTNQQLRYAMIGGGQGAFIGNVHRKAAALDGQINLVAGAFSADPKRALDSGAQLGLQKSRNHASWELLLDHELKQPPETRIDFVSIVTPNHLHFPIAKAFIEAGFHVICDKPLTHTTEQAHVLANLVSKNKTIFGVTYNYSGYPMVRQAQEMVRSGQLGTLRKVFVEYHQGWLSHHLDNKQANWRTDPNKSGLSGAMGDIGSHAENLIHTMTGLQIESICADLTAFVDGRLLEDDGSVLLRFNQGVKGILSASQIIVGFENHLHICISGTLGTLEWWQENPNHLIYYPLDEAKQILTRGSPYLCSAAKQASRLPTGHPEGFIEAFANIYLGVADAIHMKKETRTDISPYSHYPKIEAGVRGVHFIEKVVESSHSLQKWISI